MNSQGESARGTLLKLDRTSVVFEIYNPYSIVQLSEVLDELTIHRGETIIYQGQGTVSNLVNTGLMLIVSANFSDTWSHIPKFTANADEFESEALEFISSWNESRKINAGYRAAVGDICSFLHELNRWLEQLDANNTAMTDDLFKTYTDLYHFTQPILSKLDELGSRFESEAQQVDQSHVGIHKAYFQRKIHPLVMRAPFPHRTYHKPLGYAGDYEMMNMIYRSKPEGPNTYAQIVNSLYIKLPISECVRNRAMHLEKVITDIAYNNNGIEAPSIISVGCGPALELQRFVTNSKAANNAIIDLLDFNVETLQYASQQIHHAANQTGNRPALGTMHESVHALLKRSISQKKDLLSGKYDLVYCAGLFDYLSDKVCARLIRLFYDWAKPGGIVLVTNMHSSNPARYILEHGAEWYLIYRNEIQMLHLTRGLGEQRTFTDSTGINLCLEIRKIGRHSNSH